MSEAAVPADSSTFFVPKGREYRVAGLLVLSFTARTRDNFESIGDRQVPELGAYLANMAVDPGFRRCAPAQFLAATMFREQGALEGPQNIWQLSDMLPPNPVTWRCLKTYSF
jgi:hypothetical protein